MPGISVRTRSSGFSLGPKASPQLLGSVGAGFLPGKHLPCCVLADKLRVATLKLEWCGSHVPGSRRASTEACKTTMRFKAYCKLLGDSQLAISAVVRRRVVLLNVAWGYS